MTLSPSLRQRAGPCPWARFAETAADLPLRSLDGARDRTRTGTAVGPADFKSAASTSFATRAE